MNDLTPEKQIPCGNDRQKNKNKSKNKEKCRDEEGLVVPALARSRTGHPGLDE
jgi:hypothetical protein